MFTFSIFYFTGGKGVFWGDCAAACQVTAGRVIATLVTSTASSAHMEICPSASSCFRSTHARYAPLYPSFLFLDFFFFSHENHHHLSI